MARAYVVLQGGVARMGLSCRLARLLSSSSWGKGDLNENCSIAGDGSSMSHEVCEAHFFFGIGLVSISDSRAASAAYSVATSHHMIQWAQ